MGKVIQGIAKAEFDSPHPRNKGDRNVLCSPAANEEGVACRCGLPLFRFTEGEVLNILGGHAGHRRRGGSVSL